MMKKLISSAILSTSLIAGSAMAADYVIDTKDNHAFINFKISHIGFSWMYGTFKNFSGTFSYDKDNLAASKVNIVLKTDSVDTNDTARDKHIRNSDFLHVTKFPEAKFESSKITNIDGNKFDVEGNLTIHGVTKQVTVKSAFINEGNDPWGNYRAGFEGTTTIKMSDYGIKNILGEASENIQLIISFEGIRQK
jgi:polyisoprenoid-binding protein YceI